MFREIRTSLGFCSHPWQSWRSWITLHCHLQRNRKLYERWDEYLIEPSQFSPLLCDMHGMQPAFLHAFECTQLPDAFWGTPQRVFVLWHLSPLSMPQKYTKNDGKGSEITSKCSNILRYYIRLLEAEIIGIFTSSDLSFSYHMLWQRFLNGFNEPIQLPNLWPKYHTNLHLQINHERKQRDWTYRIAGKLSSSVSVYT